MEYESFIIAGVTGYIGRMATEVAKKHNIAIEGISSFGNQISLLEEQIRTFHPAFCAVIDENAAADLKTRVADTGTKIISGKYSTEEMIYMCSSRLLLNGVIGKAGLKASLAAIETGKDIALANKETLVIGGELVLEKARRKNIRIYPVDSEHCAMAQCLKNEDPLKVSRILLTASGGPFFGMTREELKRVTPEQTLEHPTWKMGRRITVDSATLMNKGFELIEAVHLFGIPQNKIEVIVHRESILHSAIEYIDNTVIAQMSVPDMRACIQYAVTGNQRYETHLSKLDLTKIGKLSFYPPDTVSFPLLPFAGKVLERGGIAPAALNMADELAVDLFLKNKISLIDLFDLVIETVDSVPDAPMNSVEDIERAEKETEELFAKICPVRS